MTIFQTMYFRLYGHSQREYMIVYSKAKFLVLVYTFIVPLVPLRASKVKEIDLKKKKTKLFRGRSSEKNSKTYLYQVFHSLSPDKVGTFLNLVLSLHFVVQSSLEKSVYLFISIY